MTNKKFKNSYDTVGKKPEYSIKYKAEDKTDQSQLASASITEMAKKYGIDALKERANQTYIESLKFKDQLYGHDFSKQIEKDDLLNVKNKLNNLFNNIPAKLRKEMFNDNPIELINAYTSTDTKKLESLNKIGLISDTQLNQAKSRIEQIQKEQSENLNRKNFINKLSQIEGDLYENFKKTGNIDFGNIGNNTGSNKDVQTGLQ